MHTVSVEYYSDMMCPSYPGNLGRASTSILSCGKTGLYNSMVGRQLFMQLVCLVSQRKTVDNIIPYIQNGPLHKHLVIMFTRKKNVI